MLILDVAPIARGGPKNPISYYTSKDVSVGDVVLIPLRSRIIYGLVIGTTSVEDMKSVVKGSSFTLKKVDTVLPGSLFLPSFVKACAAIADYFASDIGSVIVSLCPSTVLEAAEELAPLTPKETPAEEAAAVAESIAPETLVLQAPDDDRLSHYKSLVRESLARGWSVFFCVPTVHDVLRLERELKRGIEHCVYSFSSALSKKESLKRWKDSLAAPKPIVVIATGGFLALPRKDIGTYVIENDVSGAFRSQTRPYLDIRRAVEEVARASGAATVVAGSLVRAATLHRLQEHEVAEYAPPQFRSLSAATCTVLRMDEKGADAKGFVLHPKLVEVLETARASDSHAFLFNSRRGIAPIVLCKECGTTVTCRSCHAPVALHGAKAGIEAGNKFVCHRCGDRRDALEACANCQSWNLIQLGIGVDTIKEEVERLIPGMHAFVLSSDTAPTRKQAERIVATFYATPGSVLIGTELALPYLTTPVEHSAAVSIDPLFALPDFLVHERIMHVLLTLRRVATHTCMFQTRISSTQIFSLAAQGNLIDFYRLELADRKELGYPPYSTFIVLSVTGAKPAVVKEMDRLKRIIDSVSESIELVVFPAFVPVVKGKYILNGLIRLPEGGWIDRDLLDTLRSLPPYVKVVIDAESVM